MEKKVDKEFLKFVKKKNKNKKAIQAEYEEEEDIYEDEDDYEYLRLKRLSEPFNNLVKAKKKMSIEDIKEDENNTKSETVSNMLQKYKVINTKNYAIQNKDKSNKDNEQSESASESEENESDDYEDDARINHFVNNKNKHRDDVDSDIDEELETLNEMKRFEKANNYEEDEDEGDDEDDDDNKQIKKKKEKKEKKNTKTKERTKEKTQKNIAINRNNTVFIGNLPSNITENDIESKFSKFGPIKTIRLVKDKNNNTKGFGYIDFETQKAMTSAIEASVKIKSNVIKIEKAKSSFIDEVPNKTLGRKKQRAMINKAKEQLKRKQKQIDDNNNSDDDDS